MRGQRARRGRVSSNRRISRWAWPPQVVLKYLHLDAERVIFSQMVGELDFLMNRVVVPDESADESDHDERRRLWRGAIRLT